jgi:hypothetical protein
MGGRRRSLVAPAAAAPASSSSSSSSTSSSSSSSSGGGGGGGGIASSSSSAEVGSVTRQLPSGGSYQWSWDGVGGAGGALGDSPFDLAHPIPEVVSLQVGAVSQGLSISTALGPTDKAPTKQLPTPSGSPRVLIIQRPVTNTARPRHRQPPPPHLPQGLTALLQAAADSESQPSAGWMAAACAAAAPALSELAGAEEACGVLRRLAAVGYCPPGAWQDGVLEKVGQAAADGALPPRLIADALWSLSNLSGLAAGPAAAAAVRQLLAAAGGQLQDFFGPDLTKMVCAAGTLASTTGSSSGGVDPAAGPPVGLDAAWAAAVFKECEYQMVEFSADYSAFDLARMALGLSLLADLGAAAAPAADNAATGAAWPEPSGRLREALLKTVYARTRTIEEKAAVDYALARLDAKGKRSMHYDPRWTHEELQWLPRRERDKRRILKDGWYRTQWQGF